MPRCLRLAPLLAVLLAAFALPVVNGSAAACKGATERADGWTRVAPSTRPVVSYAVAATAPDTMYATDGSGVYATHDGGCAWREVLGRAEPLPLGLVTRTPVSVAVSFPRDVTLAWIASTVTVAGISHPEVLVSDTTQDAFGHVVDGVQAGGTDGVLATTGKAVAIVAGSEPDYAYLLVDEATGRRLYATTDRGASWQPRGLLSGTSFGAVRGLAADSVNGNVVWAWGDELLQSSDGGETFQAVAGPKGPFADVAVAQSPKGSRVEALATDGALWRSDDGGHTWPTITPVGAATSVAAAPVVDVAAVAGQGYARALTSIFGGIDMSPAGRDDLADAALARFPATGDVRFVVRTGAALLRRDFAVDTKGVVTPPRPGGSTKVKLLPGVTSVALYPTLVPGDNVVRLAPGETRTVPYRLDLPPTPTPVDVFFLVDTTGSMQPAIDALRLALARIVNDLTTAGIEAHYGVGSFKDFPESGDTTDVPYQLFREIGPVDQDLQLALQRLQEGGGGDGPEAQFEAIYESVHDAAGLKSFLADPEYDTRWRPGALHLEVVATDAPSHVGGSGYPGASYEDALKGLLRAHVRTVGIAASSSAKPDLRTSAQDTGSLAPPGGLDCNADGRIDIQEGLPLVCDFNTGATSNVPVGTPVNPILDPNAARGMSGAIVAMLRAQHDPQTVRLASSAPAVATVVGGVHRGVDVKVPQTVGDTVRFSCTGAFYGRTTDVRLPAFVGGRLVAEGTAKVECGSPALPTPAAPVEEVLPVPPHHAPVAVAAVPAPAPPAPIHNVNPNTNPNAQLNSNVTTQTGVAGEEQQQQQLAFAADDALRPDVGEELAMSARSGPPAPLAPMGAAVLAAAAGAYEVRRRVRTASRTVRAD